ncbi:hypothetical protein yfred0001_2830 [Yersinia frederiksenii ATCC 33641]|nr:hypothetical protein yfred0001_2830 [Yersinia frederiksenii ATCC 33641]
MSFFIFVSMYAENIKSHHTEIAANSTPQLLNHHGLGIIF